MLKFVCHFKLSLKKNLRENNTANEVCLPLLLKKTRNEDLNIFLATQKRMDRNYQACKLKSFFLLNWRKEMLAARITRARIKASRSV
jgi:hypothetical protein